MNGMNMNKVISKMIIGSGSLFFLQFGIDASAVEGQINYKMSSQGTREECVALNRMPYALYTESDLKKEAALCDIDFYSQQVALCPKVKSTSPGTYVYSLEGLNINRSEAMKSCKTVDDKAKRLATYKQTMNQGNTSATHSISSLLYYHLSRYFQTHFYVPVSVYRTMDKIEHLELVTKKARGTGMNAAGWDWLKKAEENPAVYNERKLLFTEDYSQIYGVLLRARGERYGSYFYGTRESGWKRQYEDLKKAPPIVALMADVGLEEAIQKGTEAIARSSLIRKEIGSTPSRQQMVSWMQDWSEIAVLDYIYSQQDRIGNTDYVWAWAYVKEGEVQFKSVDKGYRELSREKMTSLQAQPLKSLKPPESIAAFNPTLIQRTILGDNDAGGLGRYGNPTKKFQILEGIKHINAEFYLKLQRLADDFRRKDELYHYFHQSFDLQPKDFQALVTNLKDAAAILESSCRNGQLRFDLDTKEFMAQGFSEEKRVNCRGEYPSIQ